MYFSVGYPLGFVKEDDNPVEKYLLEFQNHKANIGPMELLMWLNWRNAFATPEKIESLKILLEHKAMLQADTNEELYGLIKHLKPIRQGMPAVSSPEPIPAILSGSSCVNLTEHQFEIWRMANANRTIQEIYSYFKQNVTEDEFVKEIVFLRSELLIYLI